MLQVMKTDDGIARAYSLDGTIFTIEKGTNGQDGKKAKINTSDHLYKLGWDEAKGAQPWLQTTRCIGQLRPLRA